MWEDDLTACNDNEKVMAGVKAMSDAAEAFMAMDDWEDTMKQNYTDNQRYIDGYSQQLFAAWDQGKYYDSGNLGGLIDTYIYKMPETD